MENQEKITVLLVEDDDGHARLVEELFRQAGSAAPLLRLRDGLDAWDFVSGRSNPALVPGGAYIMLLDIRMPGLDGVELLRRMKNDERLRSIPVFMLTTTDDPREIERCYELGCNAYMVKPLDFGKFSELIRNLALFLKVLCTARAGVRA